MAVTRVFQVRAWALTALTIEALPSVLNLPIQEAGNSEEMGEYMTS